MSASGKYLLITSDDFGMCHAVNRGILRGMTEGLLTATNLMAPCPWYPEAVHLTKEHGLKTGVHLCLTCEWEFMRWGPITRAPGLCGPDGYFYPGYSEVLESATDDEIAREYGAQIERVLASGIRPTHLDQHMLAPGDAREGIDRIREHIHAAAVRYGLGWTRDDRPGSSRRKGMLQVSGMPENTFWEALEQCVEPGLYEIAAHLAEADPELEALCSRDTSAWRWTSPYRSMDLRLFGDQHNRARIEGLGFTLVDAPTFLAMENSQPEEGG